MRANDSKSVWVDFKVMFKSGVEVGMMLQIKVRVKLKSLVTKAVFSMIQNVEF